jgi:DNA-binding NarL/FixJ family response regulator
MTPRRIAIIEDDRHYTATLAEVLTRAGHSVLTAGSAEEALVSGITTLADVAIIDLKLPAMSGIELITELSVRQPTLRCMVLTAYEESGLIFQALKAGALGYLLKRSSAAEILLAMHQISDGGSVMTPSVARLVVRHFRSPPEPLEELGCLTARERGVLQLLAQGLAYKSISDQLGISIDTVRTHIRRIYDKLQVNSRTEAMLKYLGKTPDSDIQS